MLGYIDEASVRAVLEWDPLIDAMEAALRDFSSGKVLQPVRTVLTVEEGQRYLGVMPAVAEGRNGPKLVSFYPANHEQGDPDPSCDDRAHAHRHRRATGDDRRDADHGNADGGGLGRGDEAAGRHRRPRSRAHRQRRAGPRPSRRAQTRADFRRGAASGAGRPTTAGGFAGSTARSR